MIYKNEHITHWKVEFYSADGILISTQGYCGSRADVETFAKNFAMSALCEEYIITEN